VDGRGHVPVRWLWAAFTMRFMLGDLKRMREVCEEALALSATDPSCRCEAHHAMGGALLALGELQTSKHHFDVAIAEYDETEPQRSALGSDLGVFAHAWSSHTRWLLGEDHNAVAHADLAVALARKRDHMYSETIAHAYAALLHQMRLDTARTIEHAEAATTLCERYGFAYYGDWARALIGWALAQTNPAEGVRTIEAALERLDRNRAYARRPYYLSLLGDAYLRLGNRDRAAATIDHALTMAVERGDLWWLPALYLQKSEFEHGPERAALRDRALALARHQQNRALEERTLLRTV
jgi:tetratricopeptide (TPR) repeat protein